MSLIRLRPTHTKQARFTHPLLADLKSYTAAELQQLSGDELVMALRLCLKSLVGRYIYYWEDARRLQDDLVSVGFVALSKLAHEQHEDILKTASRRIQDAIETFLNSNRSMSAPKMTKQKTLKPPVYNYAVEDVTDMPEAVHPTDNGAENMYDLLDAINSIAADDIDRALLHPDNWRGGRCGIAAKPLEQLAKELGVDATTLSRRRKHLHSKLMHVL